MSLIESAKAKTLSVPGENSCPARTCATIPLGSSRRQTAEELSLSNLPLAPARRAQPGGSEGIGRNNRPRRDKLFRRRRGVGFAGIGRLCRFCRLLGHFRPFLRQTRSRREDRCTPVLAHPGKPRFAHRMLTCAGKQNADTILATLPGAAQLSHPTPFAGKTGNLHSAGKGDRHLLCEAPGTMRSVVGPFRRAPSEAWSVPVPFSRPATRTAQEYQP